MTPHRSGRKTGGSPLTDVYARSRWRVRLEILSPAAMPYKSTDRARKNNEAITVACNSVPNPRSEELWRMSAERERNRRFGQVAQSTALAERPAILRHFGRRNWQRRYWSEQDWRRDWDSNSRYGRPHTDRVRRSNKIAQKSLALLGDWRVTVGALSASIGH